MRTIVRTLIAAFLIAVPLLASASPAGAAQGGAQTGSGQAQRQGASHGVSVAVTSMTPGYATNGSTITVQGTVSNNTGSPISGIRIALQTSSVPFSGRSEMESYASGSDDSGVLASAQVGDGYQLPRELHSGVTMSWRASFPASAAGFGAFGVYPLAAVAYDSSGTTLQFSRTLLPYWPGKKAANPVSVSWIWPLADAPQQGPCGHVMASDSLARELAANGRLGGLLDAGLRWAGRTSLTWAVDPALLNDAQTMSSSYKVGGNAACTGTTGRPASKAAGSWLSALRTGTAGQPMFITPYADPDESALVHAGLETNLRDAFNLGEDVAGKSLRRPFGENGSGTGSGGAPSIAWPAGGTADEGVLTDLENYGGASTLVLGTSQLPTPPGAVSSTTSGIGTSMKLVFADSGLSKLLGSASARSGRGAQFALDQEFTAETAMIAAEAPNAKGRAIVVAPPARWNPSAGQANALLSASASVPWLKTAGLSQLAAGAHGSRQQLPGTSQVSGSELHKSYLRSVKSVAASLFSYENLLYKPDDSITQTLKKALAATESSAWRGAGQGAGTARLIDYAAFLSESMSGVKIIAGQKVLLTGATGDIPVSLHNSLPSAVQVEIQARVPSTGQLTVRNNSMVTVPAGKTQTVKVHVHSTGIETTTMQLQLVTRNGSPLGSPPQPLTVQVTRYGRLLLILIGTALAVVVLTSAVRWIRQSLKETSPGAEGTG